MKTWHDDDSFWKAWAPLLFTRARLENAPAEVDRILALLKVNPGAAILDLCCGPGRHALEMARRGYRVTGVDRTRAYLAAARRQAAKEKLDVEFVPADMRRFRRTRAFDAVINMFTAFGYFRKQADDLRVLKNVYASLRPGGALLIDLMGKERIAKMFNPRTWHREPDGTIVLEERWLEDGFGWIENRWTIIRKGRMRTYPVGHRLYSAVELRALLKQAGFTRVKVFGDLDGSAYDQNATRLVLVAWKK
ncbi:MAG: class I SAM-dependent methyltransferase [Verrucomicrobia bacterium]|nr:class I SAM-dependent methyltransferase [Verrucomicrobiota bacterium]